MTLTHKQREEYSKTYNRFCEDSGYLNGLNSYHEVSIILDTLHRYETTLSRINTNDCNGHPRIKTEFRDGKKYEYQVEDEHWRAMDEKKEISIQNKVKAIAKKLGFEVTFNGDPRGGAIRFILPSGKSNNWDNKTWGIYW